MGMLVSLFALEHNAICDRLGRSTRHWSDDELFERARLINAAAAREDPHRRVDPGGHRHPITKIAMRANWFGLAGERIHRRFGRISDGRDRQRHPRLDAPRDYGVPFSLTEEFAAVYRMHPLLPDDYRLQVGRHR